MEITFKSAIELLAAFQAFLFALYLLLSPVTKSKSSIYIAIFLILLGLNMAVNYLIYYLNPISPNLSIFLNTTFFLMPASLYLYNKSSLQPRFKLKVIDILHFLPFIIVNIVLIPSVYLENLKENPATTDFHYALQKMLYLLFYALIFYYQALSFIFLRRSKKLYLENYSNTNIRRYRYLYTLNILFTVLFLVSASKNLLILGLGTTDIEYASVIIKFSLLVFFCWITYNGLHSPELFRGDAEPIHTIEEMLNENVQKSGALNNNAEQSIDKVSKFMIETEAFLDPTLSLNSLARQTNTPPRELSLLINHNLNKHFFDYVNEFRIEKAKSLLANPDEKDLTILEILYSVGFNSKSSFNTAFKKLCGVTPTQYRKSNTLTMT